MANASNKKNRMLEIFFRAMKGESISTKNLAIENGVSSKSISRDIVEIKNFLSESRELVGNTELRYSSSSKTYYLEFDNFLTSKELLAINEILIGCRAFNKMELVNIISKLKKFTTYHDRTMLGQVISKEIYQYNEVNSDCASVIDNIWKLTRCIYEKVEISITYYKSERNLVTRRIMPVAIIFSDYYFYLIAFRCDKDDWKPLYYRVDRVVDIIEHRKHFVIEKEYDFDEGELRKKIQFMFSGECRKIRFEYSGASVQAILDKIPTAKVIDKTDNKHIIEAETYGTGINMYLLSQGARVKVLYPPAFVEEIKEEIEKMREMY